LLYGLIDPHSWTAPGSWNMRSRGDPRAPPPDPRSDLATFITELPFFIGRALPGDQQAFPLTETNLLSLPEAPGLSRLGCRIDWDPERRSFFAQALGSNGIDVRGGKVVAMQEAPHEVYALRSCLAPGAVTIESGDTLRVGPVYAYFLLPTQAAAALTAQAPAGMASAGVAAKKRAREEAAAAGVAAGGGGGGGPSAASGSAAAASTKRRVQKLSTMEMFNSTFRKHFAPLGGFFTVPYISAMMVQQ